MTVDDAIKTATEYVTKLFGGTDHRLEEIEMNDNGSFEVTVSFRPDDGGKTAVMPLGGSYTADMLRGRRVAVGIDPSRLYKVVVVANDGQVRAVRMREIVLG